MANTRSLCIMVPRQEGEAVRKKLSELGLLDHDLQIKPEDDRLMIPIKERPSADELDEKHRAFEVREDEFESRGQRFKSYKDAVQGIPKDLLPMLPTSFDVVGDVALVKLADEILDFRKNIGEAMLKATPSVRIVAFDRGVQGTNRVRDLEVLAGQGELKTMHREHGLRFEIDLATCYFSPRLATERQRVTSLVRDGERILDMFAGVGPFSLMIAKNRKVERIWAVDINHAAVECMKRNITLNKVDSIEPVCADARSVVGTLKPVDRVIMNLPHSGSEFLPEALSVCANDATIHFYEITGSPEDRIKAIEDRALMLGRSANVVSHHEVRTYSATEGQWAFDIKVFLGFGCSIRPKE